MGVILRVGHGTNGRILDVEIACPRGVCGLFFELYILPLAAIEILHVAIHRVDLRRDAQTAGHGHEEDVARVAVGLADFQNAERRNGDALRIKLVVNGDVLSHPVGQKHRIVVVLLGFGRVEELGEGFAEGHKVLVADARTEDVLRVMFHRHRNDRRSEVGRVVEMAFQYFKGDIA